MIKTFKIQIKGQVQGVGFRPFVFNLAKEYKLYGTVSNNENGVVIYFNTSIERAEDFLSSILKNKPEIAIITSHTITEVSFIEHSDFIIVPSEVKQQVNIPLTPDFAVCESCRAEMDNPENRRFNYPFTTCVNCGPRYAITSKFPFERTRTSLSDFYMCELCNDEYSSPNNIRFHSQTNSCNTCGIELKLATNFGKTVVEDQTNCIDKVVQFITDGKILAIKNTNGYLLCCDATNTETIKTLRTRKKRPTKPFAVLFPSAKVIEQYFRLSTYEEKALKSRIAPIVILQNTKNTHIATKEIAPCLNQTGVMLPSSSLLYLIMRKLRAPIVATSGNIHGAPIISEEKEAQKELSIIADYLLHHNLDIQFPQDDSVVKFADNQELILRRSRGLAPNYINAKINSEEPVMAMGAHLKSTFTFVPNGQVYVSQYFGNLDSYGVLERYKATIKQYVNLFEIEPKTILIDKHTQYQSSILGKEWSLRQKTNLQEIQHHKAHFASVLGEHDMFNSNEKILGVIWDGTGLGDDSQIWGGEFFTYQNNEVERLTHFEYYDWLANDKMSKEPRLSLFSLLDDEDREYIKHKFTQTEWNIYSKTIKTNQLKTSSVGRLFDAVSSLLNLVDVNTFEAEPAMHLEECASTYPKSHYIDFLQGKSYEKIPAQFIIKELAKAYREGYCKEQLAHSFICTLAKSIIRIANKNRIKIIACSGGVFQNKILVSMLRIMTNKNKIILKLNRKLPTNDENISFGQLMYYQNIKN